MLDLEKIANSGELFDGHYKLLDPLSTDGATADIWLAVDMNTIEGDDKKGLKVAIKVYRPQNAQVTRNYCSPEASPIFLGLRLAL